MPAQGDATMARPTSLLLGLQLADNQSEPRVVRIGGIRHVAPYYIVSDFALGKRMAKLAAGRSTRTCSTGCCASTTITVKEALEILSRQGKRMMPTAQWWIGEVKASRVYLDATMKKKVVSANDILVPSTCLHAKFHYHEQAIADARANVLYSDDQYVVANKPPGVDVLANPAHFRVLNSLPFLLLEEMRRGETDRNINLSATCLPKPAHRLDSPVSGLVCCGRTNSDVKRLSRRIELGETKKLYVARVRTRTGGELPKLPLIVDEALTFDGAKSMARVAPKGTPGAKEATTIVEECLQKLKDGTAVVAVRILTGRKHQIRCHLQHAGIPIANDHRYCAGVGVVTKDDAGEGTSCIQQQGQQLRTSAFGMPHPPHELKELYEANYATEDNCEHCSFVRELFAGERGLGPHVMESIWLHCWKYSFPTLALNFESPLPHWAVE